MAEIFHEQYGSIIEKGREGEMNMKTCVTIFEMQVGGVNPKLITNDRSTVMKRINSQQLYFYQYMSSLSMVDPSYHMKKFLPQFRGVIAVDDLIINLDGSTITKDEPASQWIEWKRTLFLSKTISSQYLMLENFTNKISRPNIIDIKIGAKRIRNGKTQINTQNINYFSLHGFRANFGSSSFKKTIFLSKYSFLSIIKSQHDILDHLALFFFDGSQILISAKITNPVNEMFAQLEIIVFINFEGEGIVHIKLIDYERASFTGSNEVNDESKSIQGLENLHKFLVRIISDYRKEKVIQRLKMMANRYMQEKVQLIPENRKVKSKE